MRLSNKEFTGYVQTLETKIAYCEDFVTINESKPGKEINVVIVYKDNDGVVLNQELYSIKGEMYDLLMGESPDFAPGKPANEYREVDLWHIIDLIRATQ